ncbi:MAG: type II toxin-antitoxin system PemK/MazF family toxin [Chloroflexi bacterium]|nr:type II toxin-antitoxin system PemK/MazF family toxin [Chloroflexota bacterium]
MTSEPFDVVVVPFPFTDRPVARRRPALVLSSSDFLANHEQAVMAMITSSGGARWPSDVPLQDWREANLNVPSRVRLKLFTLDNQLVVRHLGTLSSRDAAAVSAMLARSLAVTEAARS